jgi:hypothetical protein
MSVARLARASLRWALAAWATMALGAVVGGCADETRCQHASDCDPGFICSNEKDLLGAGVCIDPCAQHIGVAACADGGTGDGGTTDGGK